LRVLLVEFLEQGVERGVRLSVSETSVSSETAFDPASRAVRKGKYFFAFLIGKLFLWSYIPFVGPAHFAHSFPTYPRTLLPACGGWSPMCDKRGKKNKNKKEKRRGSQERGSQIVCVVCARSVPRVACLVVERQRTNALLYAPPAMTSVAQS
jgi:hypothetical protein